LASAAGNGTIPLMSEDLKPQPTAPQPTPGWAPDPQDDSSTVAPSEFDIKVQQLAEQQTDGEDDEEPEQSITWTASEFIAHHKDARWYASVVGGTLVLAIIVRLLTRDNISTVMVVIIGAVFCIAAARKPRQLTYEIAEDGISIGEHFYPYDSFKSFSVVHEGAFASLELVPLKRFMPLTSIYCSPDNEDDAIDLLAEFLPYEERGHSLIDIAARRIRF